MRCLWLILLFIALPGHAAEDVLTLDAITQKAYIRLQNADKILSGETSQAQWLRLCQGLGQNLLVNNSSPGFLAEYICQRDIQEPETAEDVPWRITFTARPKFIDIDIQFQAKGRWIPVQTFSFHLDGEFLEDLQKASVLRFLSRLIVESLPTGWVYTHTAVGKNLELIMHPDMPLLPEELLIYELNYMPAKNLWMPKLKARLGRKQQFRNLEQGRAESFEWKRTYSPLREGERYWIQNSKGRNQRQAEYEKKINGETQGFSLLNLLDRMLFESFSSNYAGLRYGHSFVQGESVITETSLLSLLLEMRSGPLAGLRLYYDLTPRAEKEHNGLVEFFEMSRTSLGWSWEFTPPDAWDGLISRIDVQPKIGLLSFQSELAVQDSVGEYQLTAFEARRVLNLNVELGLEKESLWLRNRLWASYSSAKASIVKSNGVSVTSARIGVDAYIDLMKERNWDLKALAFGYAERLSLERDPKSIAAADSDLAIRQFGFNLLYVGGGITVSW
ncbi:MAG TPA: hypothetical protein VE954_01250 [Oligoflexus sp.]|uniref:hypothetical protein n=1 Tax=Oligoflexus sp. TaxID=1971216 RepID=UPI002D368A8C|nr:hypothetical protein [Oligoflexus sp.]HYX31708.1 hypothetical protein [Oligoflexus sp.]